MGKANKRLKYVDQVLQLVYEDGSPCPSKTGLSYKSVISFVCRPESGPTDRPVLISLDKQTCTLFFYWHSPLACEQVVSRAGRVRHGPPRGPAPPLLRLPRAPSLSHPLLGPPVILGSRCPMLGNQAFGGTASTLRAFLDQLILSWVTWWSGTRIAHTKEACFLLDRRNVR